METIHEPTLEEMIEWKLEEIHIHKTILKEIDNKLMKLYNDKMNQEHFLKREVSHDRIIDHR